MKKTFIWIMVSVLCCMLAFWVETRVNQPVVCTDEATGEIYLSAENEKIKPVSVNGKEYLFCPSYLSMGFDSMGMEVMKSHGVNTIFLDTQSGNMDYILDNKENKEAGTIRVYDVKGTLVYDEEFEYIKGRGNATWEADKKPYSLKLKEEVSILGLSSSKKYKLIANAYDKTLFANRMAFDMAKQLNMETRVDGIYADLYLNGQYAGNYLLVNAITGELLNGRYQDLDKANENLNNVEEAIPVEEKDYKGFMLNNPSDITGTYIIEKDMYGRFEEEKSAFITSDFNTFVIKEPEYASCEQVLYVKGLFQKIEDMLKTHDTAVFDSLDLESAAKYYLIDTAMGNGDQGIASMYFYKRPGDDKLYSGPVWDYDRAFGIQDGLVYGAGREISEYRKMIMCSWIGYLEEYDEFIICCKEIYEAELRPYLIELVEGRIDEYESAVSASAAMNNTLWESSEEYYNSPETVIRYVKYYFIRRIQLLDKKYDVIGNVPEFKSMEEYHTLFFDTGNEVVEIKVKDGECINSVPDFDNEKYAGYVDVDSDVPFNIEMPVLEDMSLKVSEVLNF